jgi:hypothetical protein
MSGEFDLDRAVDVLAVTDALDAWLVLLAKLGFGFGKVRKI